MAKSKMDKQNKYIPMSGWINVAKGTKEKRYARGMAGIILTRYRLGQRQLNITSNSGQY